MEVLGYPKWNSALAIDWEPYSEASEKVASKNIEVLREKSQVESQRNVSITITRDVSKFWGEGCKAEEERAKKASWQI